MQVIFLLWVTFLLTFSRSKKLGMKSIKPYWFSFRGNYITCQHVCCNANSLAYFVGLRWAILLAFVGLFCWPSLAYFENISRLMWQYLVFLDTHLTYYKSKEDSRGAPILKVNLKGKKSFKANPFWKLPASLTFIFGLIFLRKESRTETRAIYNQHFNLLMLWSIYRFNLLMFFHGPLISSSHGLTWYRA